MYRKRTAFTLIELLVVVAIIAVLISILLPSLGRAREQAKSASCLSNQRAIGVAMTVYASEYNNFIVPATTNWDAAHPEIRYYWAAILLDSGSVAGSGTETVDTGTPVLQSSVGRGMIFRCPSGQNTPYGPPWEEPQAQNDPRNDRYITAGLWTGRTATTELRISIQYAVNSIGWAESSSRRGWCPMRILPSSDNPRDFQTLKFSNIARPADSVLVYDGFQYGSSAMPRRISARHNQNSVTNILLADGHAESFKTARLPQIPNEGDFYWAPAAHKQNPLWRIDVE